MVLCVKVAASCSLAGLQSIQISMQEYSLRYPRRTYCKGKQGLAVFVPCASCKPFGKQQRSVEQRIVITATKDPDCLSCPRKDWRQPNINLARGHWGQPWRELNPRTPLHDYLAPSLIVRAELWSAPRPSPSPRYSSNPHFAMTVKSP